MAQPTSRQTLKDFALRKLGFPVIDINVDDSQLEDRLDDALQFYGSFHSDGFERVFLTHQITESDITNEYFDISAIDSNTISVIKVFPYSQSVGSSSQFFDVRYQLALNDFYGLRSGGSLQNYIIAQNHIAMMQQLLDPEFSFRFTRTKMKLHLDTDWSDLQVGDFMMFEAYAVIDPEVYTKIYNDRWMKQYITASFKRQWGANLSKFTGIQLPGGVEFNGQEIFSQANEEMEKLEETLRETYEEPPQFMVG